MADDGSGPDGGDDSFGSLPSLPMNPLPGGNKKRRFLFKTQDASHELFLMRATVARNPFQVLGEAPA